MPVSSPEDYNGVDGEDTIIPLSPLVRREEIDFDDDIWEDEAQMLFEWTRNLSFTENEES